MTQNTSTAVMQRRVEAHDSLERWSSIPDWNGYEVSDQGRVRSWKQRAPGRTWVPRYDRQPRILKPDVRNGYPAVLLIRDGKDRQWFSLNRLVLTIFEGPAPADHEAAHGDGNKSNNRLDNLRWATHDQNEADKVGHGTRLHGERIATARLTVEQVSDIRSRRASGEKVKDLAAAFGVCRNTITNITMGHYWKGHDSGAE